MRVIHFAVGEIPDTRLAVDFHRTVTQGIAMSSQKLPILSVVQTLAPFQRFYIEDQKENVWTGSQFEPAGLPVLFASQFAVRSEYQAILKSYFCGMTPVRYLVPLAVEVFSHHSLQISEVAKYLADTASFQMNIPQNGNGPGDSLVLARIDWHRIEQLKEVSNA